MAFLPGLLRLYAFAAVWGIVTGVNFAVLRLAFGIELSVLSYIVSIVLALLELILIVNWYERSHQAKPVTPEVPAPRTPDLTEAKHELDA